MKYGRSFCFKNENGVDIYLFGLRNANGTEVLISNYGCIINAFKIRTANGEIIDIVLGFDKMESYMDKEYLKKYPYFGAAIGRYANRIGNASFTIDGKLYKVSANNNTFQLHGGWEGFDRKVWDVVSFDNKKRFIEFQYVSKDGEEGFPGNTTVNLKYELNDDDELSYVFTATTDQPTAINLTHHSYFNLESGGDILDHELYINSFNVLEQDKERISTGKMEQVIGTPFDFSQPTVIREKMDVNDGIDHSYEIHVKDNEELSLAARLYSPKTKLQLEVFTTEPVVHFYAGQGIPPVTGKRKKVYGDYSGLCLETQVHPNAVNIPKFPDTVLRPGETYFHKTVYRISELPEK